MPADWQLPPGVSLGLWDLIAARPGPVALDPFNAGSARRALNGSTMNE